MVQGTGCGVEDLMFRVQGSGFRVDLGVTGAAEDLNPTQPSHHNLVGERIDSER